jgi:EmrB/QacA subfamily drug resistance transporter
METENRWIALYVLCVGVLMIVLDATVVNVALPSIKTDLDFTQNNLAWVVNAYLIAFGGLLLLAGRIGDLIGHRKVFMWGLGIFTVASLVCGLSQSQEMLIAARFVQGGGGALASAVTLGMIVTMFPEPREQAKAIGVYGFVASAGGSIGLLVGGVLTDAISWHWIFFVNVPIGIATALFAARLVASRPGIGWSQGADIPGAILVTAGLMLAVYTILGVEEHGWTSARTLILAAVSVALVATFVFREARIEKPLMPLRLFKSRNVSGANGIICALVVGMFGIFFLGALYMQQVLGYTPLEVGLAFLPGTVIMGLLSLGDVGRHPERRRPRVRPREHDRPGGRRDRAGAPGDDLDGADAAPARRRRVAGVGAHERLPPRVPDRSGAGSRRDHRGGRGPALAVARPDGRDARRAGRGPGGRPAGRRAGVLRGLSAS